MTRTTTVQTEDGLEVEVPVLPSLLINGKDMYPALQELDKAVRSFGKNLTQEEILTLLGFYTAGHCYVQDRAAVDEHLRAQNIVLGLVSRVMQDLYSTADSGVQNLSIVVGQEPVTIN